MSILSRLRAHPRAMIYPLMTAATLGLGALREMVIAQQFGLGPQLDAYAAAACFYLFFGTQIGNGLESTFIAKYAHVEQSVLRERLFASQAGFAIVMVILLALLGFAAKPMLAAFFSFEAAQLDTATHILFAFLLATLLCGLFSLPRAALYITGRYALGFSYGGLISLCVVFTTLVGSSTWGIFSIPAGYTIGNAIALGIFVAQWRKVQNPAEAQGTLRFRTWPQSPFAIWGAASMVLVVELLFQGSYLTERALAARFGDGSLSAYFYAVSLLMIFGALVVQPVATIAFPRIARQYKADRIAARHLVLRLCLYMFLLALLAAWLMHEFAQTLIDLWLVRGKFSAEDGARTAEIFQVLVFAIPFMSIARILKNSLYSDGNYHLPVLTNALRWAALAIVAGWLMPTHGIRGLAIASAASTIGDCLVMLAALLRKR